MKIHANFQRFAATNFDAAQYIASPSYGVNRFMLDRIGDETARATTIVEYQPNSRFPEHTHIGGEEFLVLRGTFKDGYGNFGAGTYVRNPIGSKHSPWVDEDGCTIMVKLLQMAEDTSTDGGMAAPLHVDLATAKENRGQPTDYGTVVELYANEATGERVQMCWMTADSVLTMDDLCAGGEELFVMDGSLLFSSSNNVYAKWGWLRFPVSGHDDRPLLKAGAEGAQVFRKTGHLTEKALAMEKIQIAEDETVKAV